MFFGIFVLINPKYLNQPYIAAASLLLIFAANCGTVWMLYQVVRYEAKPLKYALLSMLPYACFWYFFVRVARRDPNITRGPEPNSGSPSAKRGRIYVFIALAYAAVVALSYFGFESRSTVLLAPLVILTFASDFGMLWMMYQAVRFERNPFRHLLLALIPFAFVWYYVERTGAGAVERIPVAVQIVASDL